MPASNDNPVHVDPVHASTDALDNNDAAPRAKQFAPSVNTTACYQEEERFYRNHVKSTEKARATSVARRYERVLKPDILAIKRVSKGSQIAQRFRLCLSGYLFRGDLESLIKKSLYGLINGRQDLLDRLAA